MFKKILAALAAVVLGAGLSVAAVAAPTSAHTGDLNASVECVNGEYEVTYSLTIANTDLTGNSYWRIGTTNFDGTPSNNNGMSDSVPTNGSGDYVLTTITLPGDSIQAPWAYAYSVWSDTYEYGSDGGDIALGGDCLTPPPPPVDVCTNIDGPQSEVPAGMTVDANGNCTSTPPPPTCIENPAYSYTYTQAANGGVISVTGDPLVKLCDDFFVTVATWSFQLPDSQWPQSLVETQKLHIEYPGDYPYGIPVQCGQGDVYASFDSQPEPPTVLVLPHNPWPEHFLHDMVGFEGPTPTYTQTAAGCNAVVPQVPTASAADECGTYGTLMVPVDNQYFHYTVTGGKDGLGLEGIVTVVATVQAPYVVGLVEGQPAITEWPLDLGFYTECEVLCPNLDQNAQASVVSSLADTVCATAALTFTKANCFLGASVKTGTITNASWGPITDPDGPNTYSVTATAFEGYTFPGGLKQLTFEGILDPKLSAGDSTCQLTDLALVLPEVNYNDGTCSTGGSYTLGVAPGFNPAHLTWTVNGEPATNGTYPVTETTKLEIVAVPVAPNGLDGPWENPVTHTVTVPAALCGDLTTLALTGSDSQSGILALGGGILLLGILATIRARRTKLTGR